MDKWIGIVGKVGADQYDRRIRGLQKNGYDTTAIEKAISKTMDSIREAPKESFVIFGEPQSGKTEMMIALNAKLLDDGCDVIVNLLTDSVDLLQQNLSRFRRAGLSPSPKQFSELPADARTIGQRKWVVFSKKNARDLEKLKDSLRFVSRVVVVDDEADYASPNSRINNDDRSRINKLIHDLLGERGQYIGVTATPARLDLNNTFDNNTERWVDFDPHSQYVGQEFFFPQDGRIAYRIHLFDADEGDERRELRTAILHFLCGVGELHFAGIEKNFTMIVHTSGKTREHGEDFRIVERTLAVLSDPDEKAFRQRLKELQRIAAEYWPRAPEKLVEFVLRNIQRHQLVEINSTKKRTNISDILSPTSLFSFAVGGNIISRGVTFENLLSMYFTRTVKGKFTQDTYIQRARMFGNRARYKEKFQLWIPRELMANWAKCFAFHQLAIQAARTGSGAPVWLADHKSTPTSPTSIDRSSVDFNDGEMSFAIFDFRESHQYLGNSNDDDLRRVEAIRNCLEQLCFPDYVYNYLKQEIEFGESVCFHRPSSFGTEKAKYSEDEINGIRRKKGIFSTNEFRRGDKPEAKHHLKIFHNPSGKARLFYKINGRAIRFIQNKRDDQ